MREAFFFIQAFSISIYLTLAIYMLLGRSARRLQIPFTLFALYQAFDAFTQFLLYAPSGITPDVIPLPLRLRWAFAALLPALFIHTFQPLVREDQRQAGKWITTAAYGFGLLTAAGLLFSDLMILGIENRGPSGLYLISPQFSLTWMWISSLWAVPAILYASTILIDAARQDGLQRTRADARRLVFPWFLLLLSGLLSVASPFLPEAPALALAYATVERLLAVIAGLVIARGVLRFGSPVGRPVDPSILPAIPPLFALIVVDLIIVLNSYGPLTTVNYVMLLLTGIVCGLFLARPEMLANASRWLGPTPPDETRFARRLQATWESLADGSFSITEVSELLLALQDELQAAFVGLLEINADSDSLQLRFGRWEDGPRLTVQAAFVDWPLTESMLQDPQVQTAGLPGPASLILPIHQADDLVGVLLLGHPLRGGEFASSDVRLAEQFTSQLSFALNHGLTLEDTYRARPTPSQDQALIPNVPLVIRSFGRLEIDARLDADPGARPSKRARQMLAMLLAAHPQPVPAEELMAHMWPDHSPEAASNSLYVAVYSLRRAMEPGLQRGSTSRYIQRQDDCYLLALDESLWIDMLTFEKLHAQGRHMAAQGAVREAVDAFERAVRYVQGPFLQDATLDLPATVEMRRHRLHRQFRDAIWYLGREHKRLERWTQAEQAFQRLLRIDPLDEAARAELARIYRLQGLEGQAQEVEAKGNELGKS